MRDYKLVVLGAGGVGKSCLTVQFVQGIYLDSYDPTIEDSYRKTIEIDNKIFDLEILDTAGVAQFTAMRELYIKSGMGFLLVYSVTDKQSLDELMALREQVLRIKDSSRVPMVLVGNKADLTDERVISVEDGITVSSKWGKVPFYETSALLRSNVDEVFVDLVRQLIRNEFENVAKSEMRNPSLANLSKNESKISTQSRNERNGDINNNSNSNNLRNSGSKTSRKYSSAHPSRSSTPLKNGSGNQSGKTKRETAAQQGSSNKNIDNQNGSKGTNGQSQRQSNTNTTTVNKQKKKNKKKKSLCTIL